MRVVGKPQPFDSRGAQVGNDIARHGERKCARGGVFGVGVVALKRDRSRIGTDRRCGDQDREVGRSVQRRHARGECADEGPTRWQAEQIGDERQRSCEIGDRERLGERHPLCRVGKGHGRVVRDRRSAVGNAQFRRRADDRHAQRLAGRLLRLVGRRDADVEGPRLLEVVIDLDLLPRARREGLQGGPVVPVHGPGHDFMRALLVGLESQHIAVGLSDLAVAGNDDDGAASFTVTLNVPDPTQGWPSVIRTVTVYVPGSQ